MTQQRPIASLNGLFWVMGCSTVHVFSFLENALNPLDQDRPKHGQDGRKHKEQRVTVKRVHHEGGNGDTHDLWKSVGDIDHPKVFPTSVSRGQQLGNQCDIDPQIGSKAETKYSTGKLDSRPGLEESQDHEGERDHQAGTDDKDLAALEPVREHPTDHRGEQEHTREDDLKGGDPLCRLLVMHRILQKVQEITKCRKVTQIDQEAREPGPAKIRMLHWIDPEAC